MMKYLNQKKHVLNFILSLGLLCAVDGIGCAHHQTIVAGQEHTEINQDHERRVVEQAFSKIVRDERASLCVMFDGKEVLHKPFSDGREQRADLMSVTKSVVALGVGIAVDQGAIQNIDEPIGEQFPNFMQNRHRGLSLRHLLTMTAGLTQVGQSNEKEVYDANNTVALAKECEQHAPPGTRWDYDNRALGLVAGVMKEATSIELHKFLERQLFLPLGIENWFWQSDADGHPYLMAGLSLSSVDLAKIGQVVANHGTWYGKTLVSRAWITLLGEKTPVLSDGGYGLLWWIGLPLRYWEREETRFDNLLWSQGYAHQYLFVDQDSNTVISILHRPPADDQASENQQYKWDEVIKSVVQVLSARRKNIGDISNVQNRRLNLRCGSTFREKPTP